MQWQGEELGSAVRRIIRVTGVVQGVGFRPFIYRLATARGLAGWVVNTPGGVEIDVEGPSEALDGFEGAIRDQAPPMSRIAAVESVTAAPTGRAAFEIAASQSGHGWQHVSPDTCTCPDCLRELFDPQDRRYRYPFINCTACGPRFTIIEDLPYDRPLTSMRRFEMCGDCRQEYEDPADRRFHAEPNACPVCGPRLWLAGANGAEIATDDAVARASLALRAGAIVAIKGLGGFQLACLAGDGEAISRLRQRKRRPHKPFAVMAAGFDEAAAFCHISPEERRLLESPERPIVLMELRSDAPPPPAGGYPLLSPAVAPGLGRIGVMLPCAPVHFLLIQEAEGPLVMTSGNLSDEPICRTNSEALSRLSGIADLFLFHDRRIISTYDDSVVMVARGKPFPIRRARGYAPLPVDLGAAAEKESSLLATGAQLKNTFCLVRGRDAFLSQHIGDLEDAETLLHYERTVDLYERLFRTSPEAVACDLHPEYLASAYARERARQPMPIQHHRAHVAACLAENGFPGPAVGVSFDGTGLGDDGAVWGGEFFRGSLEEGLERAGHIEYMPLPGGDAAIREPWRAALGAVWQHAPERFEAAARLMDISAGRSTMILRQLDAQVNCPPTSSCGRLFDAMAALVLGRTVTSYEGQAAMELEAAATAAGRRTALDPGHAHCEGPEPFCFPLYNDRSIWLVSAAAAIETAIDGVLEGEAPGSLAAGFHLGLSRAILQACTAIAAEHDIEAVALSGGVFQNRLLLELVERGLEGQGLAVLRHRLVPPNDGGLSLGQAALALYQQGF